MPGRKAYPGQHEGQNRFGPRVGGRCLVGDDVPAPHRVTIRLSETQWQQLNAVADDMRKPLAKVARLLLVHGAALYWVDPEAMVEGSLPKAQKRKARPVVAASSTRPAGQWSA